MTAPDRATRIRALALRYFDAWMAVGAWDNEADNSILQCLELVRNVHRVQRGVLGISTADEFLQMARGQAAAWPNELDSKMLLKLVDEIEAAMEEK